MDLPDEISLEEYDALPATMQIFYSKGDEKSTLDLGLNNILGRGGYTSAQNKLRKQADELAETVNQFKQFADTPEALAEKIRNWEALESASGSDNINKTINELKAASAKQLKEELEKQASGFKQQIAELDEINKTLSGEMQGIKLWEGVSKLAPDLAPKFKELFKKTYLELFTLDDDGSLKLSGTDPESQITTPAKKMESIRKEFPEMFIKGKESEFSPYNRTTGVQPDSVLAKNDYYEAVKNRDINAMLAAQRRMQ